MSAPVIAPAAANSPTGTRSPRSPGWAFLLSFALLFLFGGLIWWVVRGSTFKDVDQRRAEERFKIYDDVVTSADKTLHDPPSYLDKDKGVVRLPIDLAMKLELAELKNSKPEPGYPLSQSPPAPNPPPAPEPAGGNTPAPTNNLPPTNANNPALPNQSTVAAPTPSPAVSPVHAGATPPPPPAASPSPTAASPMPEASATPAPAAASTPAAPAVAPTPAAPEMTPTPAPTSAPTAPEATPAQTPS